VSADESPYDVDVRNDLSGADYSAPDRVVGLDGKSYPATRTNNQRNPALEHLTLEELEEWNNLAAGLHFRHDLRRVVHLRSEARSRAVQRQRHAAHVAVKRLESTGDTSDEEIKIQHDTAVLYKKLTGLIAAGHLRWDDHKGDWVKRPVLTRTDNRPPAYTSDELLDRFDKVRRNGRGWTGRCPAHNDRNPSLAIAEGDKGWLLKCWANCDFRDIVAAAPCWLLMVTFEAGQPSILEGR